MVRLRPVFAPLLDGFAIASEMVSKQVPFFIKDVNMERIRLDCHFAAGFGNWHRIAVGFKRGLIVRIESSTHHLTAIIVKWRQGMKKRFLLLPRLTNRHRLPVDPPAIILHTSLKKQVVEGFKRVCFGNRYHMVSATEPNPAFDLSFLPPGTRG